MDVWAFRFWWYTNSSPSLKCTSGIEISTRTRDRASILDDLYHKFDHRLWSPCWGRTQGSKKVINYGANGKVSRCVLHPSRFRWLAKCMPQDRLRESLVKWAWHRGGVVSMLDLYIRRRACLVDSSGQKRCTSLYDGSPFLAVSVVNQLWSL